MGYRREQEDGGGQRTKKPLRRSQKIVSDAEVSSTSFGYCMLVRGAYLPFMNEKFL